MGTMDRVAVSRERRGCGRGWGSSAAAGGLMPVRFTRLAVVAFVLVVPAMARAEVRSPTIEGPIADPAGAFIGSPALLDPQGSLDLSKIGYEQQEYFISGMASAYTSTGPLGDDGMWSVAPGA